MTESREELIQALVAARADGSPAMLDAVLAHPGAVLSELENAPCETCGGRGEVRNPAHGGEWMYAPVWIPCSACGGRGKLGRDGLLRALGMVQVGAMAYGEDDDGVPYLYAGTPDYGDLSVFAHLPVPVPEPSEGE